MNWKSYFLLFICGLILVIFVSTFQAAPGYMDADYYYAGGLRLAEGYGFSENILWNYLDNPVGIPHPSHAYWMPLASITAAAGLSLTQKFDLVSARLIFIPIAACIPPLTAALAYSITSRHNIALTAGFLALFSGFYIPYFSTTDTFGLYMFFGVLFLLVVGWGNKSNLTWHRLLAALALGLLAGLMHLSRADGILWLFLSFLAIFLWVYKKNISLAISFSLIFLSIVGYLLVMGPWFVRNTTEFGSLLSPGGSHALWLQSYDQTFIYPADQLTMNSWLSSGWKSVIDARISALKWNLQTVWAVQGGIFLLPLIMAGGWHHRRDIRIVIGIFAFILTFSVMTIIFPFAGSRGGLLHSGAALQPLWWALAPVGLEIFVQWGGKVRSWRVDQAFSVFSFGMISIAFLLSIIIFFSRVLGQPAWGNEAKTYTQIEKFIQSKDASSSDVIMVGNPPGYYIASGRSAIAVPDGDLETLLKVSDRYNAHFFVLEKDGTPDGLKNIYLNADSISDINYLGEVDGDRIFKIP